MTAVIEDACNCGHPADKHRAGRGKCWRCDCLRYRAPKRTPGSGAAGSNTTALLDAYESGLLGAPSATQTAAPTGRGAEYTKPLAVYRAWLCEACGTHVESSDGPCCGRTPIPVTVTITRRENR